MPALLRLGACAALLAASPAAARELSWKSLEVGATLDLLLRVDAKDWAHELEDQRAFYAKFGDRLPREILRQHTETLRRLGLAD